MEQNSSWEEEEEKEEKMSHLKWRQKNKKLYSFVEKRFFPLCFWKQWNDVRYLFIYSSYRNTVWYGMAQYKEG